MTRSEADRLSPKIGVRDPLPGVVYPDPERLSAYLSAGILTTETLGQAFHAAAVRFADDVAIVSRNSGRRFTYAEMDRLSDRYGAALLDIGLRPRDRIIFQIGNVEDLFFCLYGCFKAGIIPIATLPNHREQEIGFLADFAEARAHIVQGNFRRGDLPQFAKAMAGKHPGIEHTLTVCGGDVGLRLEDLAADQDPDDARKRLEALDLDPFDVAIFQLSGGTTGIPKVIPRFHNEYLYNMRAWAQMAAYGQDTAVYWPLPIIHNAGLVCGPNPVHLEGGRVILQESLAPEAILETIQEERVTTAVATIPLIVRILDSGILSQYDLSSVRDFISAGETELVRREIAVPGSHLFGMSEGLCMRTRYDHPEQAQLHTVGQPLSAFDEVRLLVPGTEEPVADGETGELCCRGPYTIRGYYCAEEHNKKAFTSDGFYRSGDLMRLHNIEGAVYYSFEGRIKDNIDRGGEKISAEEVERQCLDHPAVREVAVIGMPDREFGERVCAYVIVEHGEEAPTVEALRSFLLSKGLAKYKCPERVEIVTTFPVTKVGKVSKPELKADIAQKLQSNR